MIDDRTLEAWFHKEIFVLDRALTRFIRRNWRDDSEIADLRQEVYAKVYTAAKTELPRRPKAFLFTTARNHLINQARRAKIVSIEHVADLSLMPAAIDPLTPLHIATAREELRQLQAGLERLPPRCRQVVMLRKIDGLTPPEIAERLNIAVSTVDNQLAMGMRALIDYMLGGSGQIRRATSAEARSSRARRES